MILALDYGTARIGVAVSDATGILASPLPHLKAEPFKGVVSELQKIITERGIKKVLVGLPRNMDGSYGPATEAVRAWIAKLEPQLKVPIQTIDERLSTVQASRMLHEAGRDTRQQRQKIDSAAAQVLLQSYLDIHGIL
jgi:putative Holliday junction resolvase